MVQVCNFHGKSSAGAGAQNGERARVEETKIKRTAGKSFHTFSPASAMEDNKTTAGKRVFPLGRRASHTSYKR